MKKFGKWFKELPDTKQFLFIAVILIALFAGGSALSPNTSNTADKKPPTTTTDGPTIITKTVTEARTVNFDNQSVDDSSLPKGTNKVTTQGANGTETLTYKVTYSDGAETNRQLIKTEVTKQPVTQISSRGTYVAPPKPKPQSNCDPNYTGACVPNVYPSDVDCAGGSGNGPYYVQGPVTVVGTDHYGLDRGGNGIGCE